MRGIHTYDFGDEMEEAIRDHFRARAEAKGSRKAVRIRKKFIDVEPSGVEIREYSSQGETVRAEGLPGEGWKVFYDYTGNRKTRYSRCYSCKRQRPIDEMTSIAGHDRCARCVERSGKRAESGKLREMETPSVFGYEMHRETLTPIRPRIDFSRKGDYGADPIGDGTFRMVPSGDIVDLEERNRRLKR